MIHIFPHPIQSKSGEKRLFHRIENEPDGDRLIVENFVDPNAGPPMHVHFQQDEGFTVVSGQIGYQVLGEAAQYAGPGSTLEFKRGVPHRFWNAGTTTLHGTGWIKPANTFVFFLSGVYAALNNSRSPQPEVFDSAYLLRRYRREYDMLEIPPFVKKVIFPVVYALGLLLGKYRKFRGRPAATVAQRDQKLLPLQLSRRNKFRPPPISHPPISCTMFQLPNLAALLLLTMLCTNLSAQTADEKAIYAVIEEGFAAFEARNADRFAAIFTEQADFIPPVGHLVHGKEEMAG